MDKDKFFIGVSDCGEPMISLKDVIEIANDKIIECNENKERFLSPGAYEAVINIFAQTRDIAMEMRKEVKRESEKFLSSLN